MARDWLLITVSTPPGGSSTLRVYAWRKMRSMGAHYLQLWLAAIRARDYFDAPGGQEATAAVASCEEALARFESEALSKELDEPTSDSRPGLHAVERPNG